MGVIVYVNIAGEIVLRCDHEFPPMGNPICGKCREAATMKLKEFFKDSRGG